MLPNSIQYINPATLDRNPGSPTLQAHCFLIQNNTMPVLPTGSVSHPKTTISRTVTILHQCRHCCNNYRSYHGLADIIQICLRFPIAGLGFAQWPRSALAHIVSDDLMILAFIASAGYTDHGSIPTELFVKQIIIDRCPQVPRVLNGSQILGTLLVINDAIGKFSAYVQSDGDACTARCYKMGIKPGWLFSYLWESFYPAHSSCEARTWFRATKGKGSTLASRNPQRFSPC